MSETSVKADFNYPEKELPGSNALIILLCSILLGFLFNTLFYGKIPALSFVIFVSAFYTAFFICFKGKLNRKSSINNILVIFILLLAATYSIFTNPVFMLLNIITIPVLIAAHTILTTEKNSHIWYDCRFIGDLVYGVLQGAFSYIFKPVNIISHYLNIKSGLPKNSSMRKVLVGLALSAPLLFVVIILLASADAVFENMINNAAKIFTNLNLGDLTLQLFLILAVSLVVFSYLWSLTIKNNRQLQTHTSQASAVKHTIDPIIAVTILTVICLVYCLFTFIQFKYLFGSLSNNLPSSLTYAEYARRGFFELVLVTLINLSLLIINTSFSDKNNSSISLALNLLNTLLVFCTGVMLFSAHFRMSLYENMYGYTYLRLFTHAFMLYIFLLLLTALVKVWHDKLSFLKYFIVISILAFTIINYANADKIIAKENIERYKKTGKIDVYYLTRLSYEAMPQIIDFLPELRVKNIPLSKALENQLYFKKKNLAQWNSWQSFNFSISRAKKLLVKYNFKYDPSVAVPDYRQYDPMD